MSERQRGLGRGLSALLGEVAAESEVGDAAPAPGGGGVNELPIDRIGPNPDQPRKLFTETEVEELAQSIREKGVLQPILVRQAPGEPGRWQIVAGERRWRAAQRAGLTRVPALVRDLDDIEVLEIGVIENVQRTDLNAIEEALAYRALMERFGRTQDAVSRVVGKSRSHIANTLRLLNLPESVRDHVLAGRLSAGHARALIGAHNEHALAARIVAEGLSVRQAEMLARGEDPYAGAGGARSRAPRADGAVSPRPVRADTADTRALEQDLADVLGLHVTLKDRGGQGELTIRYSDLEQLDDLCRRLMRRI